MQIIKKQNEILLSLLCRANFCSKNAFSLKKIGEPHVEPDGKIKFYGQNRLNGVFSNLYPSPITLKGLEWPTSEHYFQAMKYEGTEKAELIRQAKSAVDSFILGRQINPLYPLRTDWENVKDDIMYQAIQAKFTQHKELHKFLLNTGDRTIIEHTVKDRYWADGGDGSGKNMLGILLMKLREQLRSENKQ